MRKILLIGSSGICGQHFLKLLAANPSIKAYCTYFNSPVSSLVQASNIHYFRFDSSTPLSLSCAKQLNLFEVDDIVLHSNIRHLPNLLGLLYSCGLKKLPRLILIGTTGIYSKFPSYSDVYRKMEEMLDSYPAPKVLLRPSMIVGHNRDKNLSRVYRFIQKNGFFVVFGSGGSLVQPVFYQDLAFVLYEVVSRVDVQGSFNVCGAERIRLVDLIKLMFIIQGKKPLIFYLPLKLSFFILRIFELLGFKPLVNSEQILRQSEDKTFPVELTHSVFSHKFATIRDSISRY